MFFLILLLAYLIGSLSFAVLLSRAFGMPDPRGYGSGNPGATNVLRSGRKIVAALTLLGDGIKGAAGVWIALWLGEGQPVYLPALAGLAAFCGHLWPIFFGFKGGKGVATAVGFLLALNLWLGLACVATWLVVFWVSRISSLSALTAAALAPVFGFFLTGEAVTVMALSALAALIFWRHVANIQRLLRGEEGNFRKKG